MALDELFQALNMFKQGAQDLGVARGIQAAQDQVAQVNKNVTDEIEKRAALQQISNDLALNLGKIGAPVSDIQSAVGAIAPTPIRNANEAHMAGLMAPGKSGAALVALSENQQKFEEGPKTNAINLEGAWHVKAAEMQGARAAAALDAKQTAAEQKSLIEFGKQLDPTQSRAGEYGKLYNQLVQTQKLKKLTADGLNVPESNQEEFALGLHRLISGGSSAHVEQVKALLPKSFVNASAKGASYVLNVPLPLNNAAWMANLMKTVNREEAVVTKNYKEIGYRRVQNFEQFRETHPDQFIRRLKAAGLTPEEYDAFMSNGGQLPEEQQQQQQQQQATEAGVAPTPQSRIAPQRPSIFQYQVK